MMPMDEATAGDQVAEVNLPATANPNSPFAWPKERRILSTRVKRIDGPAEGLGTGQVLVRHPAPRAALRPHPALAAPARADHVDRSGAGAEDAGRQGGGDHRQARRQDDVRRATRWLPSLPPPRSRRATRRGQSGWSTRCCPSWPRSSRRCVPKPRRCSRAATSRRRRPRKKAASPPASRPRRTSSSRRTARRSRRTCRSRRTAASASGTATS